MTADPVKSGNRLAWNGMRRPFHELYSLRAGDSNGKWALWLRYGLDTWSPLHSGGTAFVAAVFTERDGPPLAIRQDFELAAHDVMHADEFIRIAESKLSLAECAGAVSSETGTIKWELGFEDPVEGFDPYRRFLQRALAFPFLRRLSPRLSCRATGTVYVAHRSLHLRHAKIHQHHTYGTGLPGAWAWGICNDFEGDETASFEALSVRSLVAGRPLPPLKMFSVACDGRRFTADSPAQLLLRNLSRPGPSSWEGAFTADGHRFAFRILRPPETTLTLVHHGPRREILRGDHGLMADAELRISRRRRGSWQEIKALSSSGRCFYETAAAEKGL